MSGYIRPVRTMVYLESSKHKSENRFKLLCKIILRLFHFFFQEKQMIKIAKACRVTEEQEMFNNLGLTYLRTARQVLEPMCKPVNSVKELVKLCPSKIARLLELLSHYKPKKPAEGSQPETELINGKKDDSKEFSGIIFVEQRYVAFILKVLSCIDI